MSAPRWAGWRDGEIAWYARAYWWLRWFVWPRHRYETRCQYCAERTGETPHKWATEDVCAACARRLDVCETISPAFDYEGEHVDDISCSQPASATTEDGVRVCEEHAQQWEREFFEVVRDGR